MKLLAQALLKILLIIIGVIDIHNALPSSSDLINSIVRNISIWFKKSVSTHGYAESYVSILCYKSNAEKCTNWHQQYFIAIKIHYLNNFLIYSCNLVVRRNLRVELIILLYMKKFKSLISLLNNMLFMKLRYIINILCPCIVFNWNHTSLPLNILVLCKSEILSSLSYFF